MTTTIIPATDRDRAIAEAGRLAKAEAVRHEKFHFREGLFAAAFNFGKGLRR